MKLLGRSTGALTVATRHGIAVISVAAVLAGCSGGDTDGGGSSQPAASESQGSGETTAASSSASSQASSSSAPSSSSTSELTAALITAADIGAGFTGGPSKPSGNRPFPCTPKAKPLSDQVPPKQRVFGVYRNKGNTVAVSETITEYAGEAQAQRAYRVAGKGFGCSRGTLDGRSIKIVKRAPSQTAAGVTLAAWDFADAQGTKGTIVALRKGSQLIALQFIAQGSAGSALNVGTVTDRAVARLR